MSKATSADLHRVFLSHLDMDPGEGAILPEDLDALVLHVCEAGRTGWPDLDLDASVFTAHLAERLTAGPDLAKALAGIHAADLYLACACLQGIPGALASFDRAYAPTIATFVRHVNPAPEFAGEVHQILRRKLFVPGDEGEPPKITGYSGRGALSSWVGVSAQRAGLDLLRPASAKEVHSDEGVAEALPAGVDPELDYLKTRYKTEFRAAFEAAFGALAQRERVILRLSLVKRLSHEKIAEMYGVTQPTVTRWMAKARESLAHEAQRYLRDRCNVQTEDFHSIGKLVQSQLDLSITRLLGEDE